MISERCKSPIAMFFGNIKTLYYQITVDSTTTTVRKEKQEDRDRHQKHKPMKKIYFILHTELLSGCVQCFYLFSKGAIRK